MSKWISVDEDLPETGDDVLVVIDDNIIIAHLSWENPTYEETHKPFQYWSDNDGMMIIEWHEVTHWMPLPELPND